jgi:hypothetical protein
VTQWVSTVPPFVPQFWHSPEACDRLRLGGAEQRVEGRASASNCRAGATTSEREEPPEGESVRGGGLWIRREVGQDVASTLSQCTADQPRNWAQDVEFPILRTLEGHNFREASSRLLVALARPGECSVREYLAPSFAKRSNDLEFLFVRFLLPFRAVSIHNGFRRKFSVHLLYGSLPTRVRGSPRICSTSNQVAPFSRLAFSISKCSNAFQR